MSATRVSRLGVLATLVATAVLASGCDGSVSDDADATVGAGHEWSYAEIGAWDDTCATGREQSPLDLTGATTRDLPDLGFDYRPAPATVLDNGHTVQTAFDGAGSLGLDGEAFELRQLHFHSPSEHLLEGVSYAAEIHLVHEAADGRLAVVGVLVEEGSANPLVAEVLPLAPAEGAQPAGVPDLLDPVDVLPADRRAFRYDGSLTTPPCTEGVAWAVLAEPVTWSPQQLAAFVARHPDSHRPPQPLEGRVLLRDMR